MAYKKNNRKRNYGKKRVVKRATIRKIAKSAVMSTIPIKKHLMGQNLVHVWGAASGEDSHGLDPESNINWVVFKPLALAKSTKDDDANTRTESKIFAKNYLLHGELMMPKQLKGCVQVRVVMGHFKGTGSLGAQAFQANVLQASLDTATSKFDPQLSESKAYRIVSDTMRTYHPLQIYDNTTYDSVAESSRLTSDNVALWKPIVIKRNFKFNRRYQYDNDDGDSQVGWLPFIAIGVFPCENAAIGPNDEEYFARGDHGFGPNFAYESRMYFQDLND